MGKAKGKHRLDKFYHLAKEHGYRSRASWKLVQLNSKFRFLESAHAVLDLCAAPGGWMQVAVQRVPVDHLVLGVDLAPIREIRGAVAIQEDITRPECRARIKKLMNERGCQAFNVILHDGSPNVGGAWAQEATSQNALVIDAVKLATQFLAPKGTFVTKVFRSQDYSSVLYCLKQLFEKVEVDKPAASRSESAEIYVVGLKYKAPAKIDPRLLDVKHLFQGSVEPQTKVVDVLRPTKQKRHRGGYEDGDTTLRKVSSAANFIWSDSPLEILGTVTSITFNDPADLTIKDHDLTTEEVKALCDDLRVLGKQDFKHLLKWRIHIRKALSRTEKSDTLAITEVEDENKEHDDDKEDGDDKILNEMEELTYAIDRKKKHEKKRLAKRKAKEKARQATGMHINALEDGYIDPELFSLSSIKGKKDLAALSTTEYDVDEGELKDSDNEETNDDQESSSSDVEDSDEEHRRYDEKMEELFDQAYERIMAKKEGSAKQRKRVKKSYEMENQLLEDAEADDIVKSKYDSDEELEDQEANPLMVPLDEGLQPTQEEIMKKWFSQDVFTEAVEEGDLGNEGSDYDMDINEHNNEKPSVTKEAIKNKAKSSDGMNNLKSEPSKKGEDDFEVVPAPATDSSDDSDSSENVDDYSVEEKAEILAYAKKCRMKKQREQMLDDAYNKYMYEKEDGLPKWFEEEERRHRQLIKPVTKEEIDAMKAQFKEINARPAKKVAEAKARKKRVAMRKLEKVRKKANAISEQADISDRSKSKQIERLYKKAEPKKPRKEYVVAKKGVQVKTGKGKVLVDRRMKKDLRKRGTGKPGRGSSKGKKGAKVPKGKAKASSKTSKKGRN
ncbi:hypothetical protein QN277_005062 [Acacia crassicarpa]|uniref:Putative rRNA methyltransferase n=1 Tax=Acacia crassicarpa TaxID=499986 RepID=A0AAE1IX77_9FABA|nr:hypothetical protein QN277_005062 [Acacia crassicarpa]